MASRVDLPMEPSKGAAEPRATAPEPAAEEKKEDKKRDDDEPVLVRLNPGEEVAARRQTFVIMEKLGEGGFGAVYKVSVKDAPRQIYAMKTEVRNDEDVLVLKVEVEVLRKMEKIQSRHFCRVLARGRTDKFSYVVMTCVGKSLSELRKKMPRQRFSLSTAVRTCKQTLVGLEQLHSIDYIHRDIKPGNFAIGRPEDDDHRNIYVLDFGMCRKFRTHRGELRYPRNHCEFRGTVRYASLHCHQSKETCRGDDLESWFYMLIELTRGQLPWKSIADKDLVLVEKEKARTPEGIAALLDECPSEYNRLFKYIVTIEYWDRPDYEFCKHVLERCMTTRGIKPADQWDWEKLSEINKSIKNARTKVNANANATPRQSKPAA